MPPIVTYTEDDEVPTDPKEAKLVQKRAFSYSIIEGNFTIGDFLCLSSKDSKAKKQITCYLIYMKG